MLVTMKQTFHQCMGDLNYDMLIQTINILAHRVECEVHVHPFEGHKVTGSVYTDELQ